MQMKKLMDSIRPFADPIVQTACMTVPASTEVKLSASLTELATGSDQKPNKPIAPYMLTWGTLKSIVSLQKQDY